jgi:ribosomal RNA assembly protein
MEFIKVLKINKDRLGVIIGKNGEQKRFIESTFNVKLDIDSRNNEVKITASDVNSDPLTAALYIEALGRGFSPERASDLLREGYTMVVIYLRDYAFT